MKFLPWIGAAAVLAAGVLTFAQAGSAAEAEDVPSSLVEDYSYPAGDAVEGIRLIKGDGNITLVECANGGSGLLRVRSYVRDDEFCFAFRGAQGYLALVLEDAYQLRDLDADHSVEAKVTDDGVTQTPVTVPEDRWAVFEPATLLELRSQA
ncbi:hypothetical protein [Actinoplanes xinjiangensis]|uniref:Uncharacterized protein n=1 Tax=Actinoplanes xinjiangensis TaxID=512350 RepID=A0A316F662_9ACTN|nr:hypothetical protein [Actinoplanes xinjiangensis]PWK40806.1 hypothetical protein BC793_11835 [Actinoplanes xinjiangensis]GIF41337.1 hypothetical protein Axi01nite_56480 [Actinoplanes xinjiangensis]